MKEISASMFNENVFDVIGKKWMLISAKKNEDVNAMTASWGGMGVMWGKNVIAAVIRKSRYTKEFVDASEYVAMSFLGEEYRKTLSYMGSVSGRDENKIEKSGLTVEFDGEAPYFKESDFVIKAKKLFVQEMNVEGFIDKELEERWYADKDYHVLYVCEIEKVLIKED